MAQLLTSGMKHTQDMLTAFSFGSKHLSRVTDQTRRAHRRKSMHLWTQS